MVVKSFEDLEIWQGARELCKDIYAIARKEEFSKDYRFVGQITAAAGSIMDNIAEGFERDGNKEFLQFLSIAKGSCGELRSQIYRAFDVGYIDEEICNSLLSRSKRLSSSIYFFAKSLKSSEIKGNKYKKSWKFAQRAFSKESWKVSRPAGYFIASLFQTSETLKPWNAA